MSQTMMRPQPGPTITLAELHRLRERFPQRYPAWNHSPDFDEARRDLTTIARERADPDEAIPRDRERSKLLAATPAVEPTPDVDEGRGARQALAAERREYESAPASVRRAVTFSKWCKSAAAVVTQPAGRRGFRVACHGDGAMTATQPMIRK